MQEEIILKLKNNIDLKLDELQMIRNFSDYNTLCNIFGKKHVARIPEEINEETICYVGDLIIEKIYPTYNLKYIFGILNYTLDEVYNLENLIFVEDSVFFNFIKNAFGLENLKYIGGHACFNKIKNSDGLDSLIGIENDASFAFLEDASGLNNLEFIGNSAFFPTLHNYDGFTKLNYIGGEQKIGGLNLYDYKIRCLKK